MNDTIEKEIFPRPSHDSEEKTPIAKTVKTVFALAKEHNLIEVADPAPTITRNMRDTITKEVHLDREALSRLFPNYVKIGHDETVPGQLFVDGQEYCEARIWSIYASLILAREWNAQCLFSESVLNYCKYKFGSSLVVDPRLSSPPNAFDTIFNSFLPEHDIFPGYVFQSEKTCVTCPQKPECAERYLDETQRNLLEFLELREHDDIQQIKNVLSDIVDRLRMEKGQVRTEDIVDEFKSEEKKISRRMYKIFPKIKRWTNLGVIASVPVTVVGFATGLPIVSAIGASVLGSSKVADEYIKYLESRYKWVGLINRSTPSKKNSN